MRKTLVVFAVLFATFFTVGAAQADQGAYGTVYAWRDGSNDCYVQNAVVRVYNMWNQYVTQTTASVCGYYTVSLSPGIYHLVVGGTYNERDADACGTIIDNEYVGGDEWVTIVSSGWNHQDIDCL